MARRKYPDYVYPAAKLAGTTPKRFYEGLHDLRLEPSWADLAKHPVARPDPAVTRHKQTADELKKAQFAPLFERICALADPKRWERYEQPWSLRLRALPRELSDLARLAEALADRYAMPEPEPLRSTKVVKTQKPGGTKKASKKRAAKKTARRRKKDR